MSTGIMLGFVSKDPYYSLLNFEDNITKSKSDNIYWDCISNIFNFLKCFLHESPLLIPTMIQIVLFCNLKMVLL